MAHDDQKEYASKGVAGSGLGLGIAGTALALLNNGGTGLAGLLGGGPNAFAANHGGYAHGYGHGGFDTRYIIENERRIGCMEGELAALKVGQVKDKEISFLQDQLSQANMFRYVDDKTCGVVRGQNLLNPNQIADPYMGQRLVISTHSPYPYGNPYGNNCGPQPNCRDYERFY